MKLALEKDFDGDYCVKGCAGRGFLCHIGLRKFFDVPKSAKTLYITICDKERRGYEKVTYIEIFGDGSYTLDNGNTTLTIEYTLFDLIMRRFGKSDIWVKIEYI